MFPLTTYKNNSLQVPFQTIHRAQSNLKLTIDDWFNKLTNFTRLDINRWASNNSVFTNMKDEV